MKSSTTPLVILCLALLLGIQSYADEPERGGPPQTELSIDDLPQEVRDALNAELPGLEITEIEQEGNSPYEIEGTVEGSEVEIRIMPNGEFVRIEIDGEEDDDDEEEPPLTIDDLPQEVSDALAAEVPDLEITEIELQGNGIYEIKGTVEGSEAEIRIMPNGEFVRIEIDGEEDDDDEEEPPLTIDDLPQEVSDALAAEVPDLEITEIELQGNGIYEIKGTVEGSEAEIKIMPDGEFVRIEIEEDDDDEEEPPLTIDDLPQEVRDALTADVPGLAITEIELQGNGIYEIKGTVEGSEAEIKIMPDGEFVRIEIDGEEDDDEEEPPLTIDDLPQDVQDALAAEVPSLEITEIELQGNGIYEIKGTVEGSEAEIKIMPDGEFVRIEIDGEDDTPLTIDDLPQEVRDALAAGVPGLEITEIELQGNGIYEIEGIVEGSEAEIKIMPDGEFVRIEIDGEEDDDDDDDDTPLTIGDLPQEVQDALAAEVPGLEITEIEQEGNGVIEIEGMLDGDEVEIKIRPDGEFVRIEIDREEEDDEELTIDDLPQEIQDALAAEVPGLEITEIEHEGNGIFEIEGVLDGNEVEIKVKPDGRIVRIEIEGEVEDRGNPHLSPEDLPEAIVALLAGTFPDVEVLEVKRKTWQGFDSYQIIGTSDTDELELRVTEDGVIVKFESSNGVAQAASGLPELVAAALNEVASEMTVRQYRLRTSDHGDFYRIEGLLGDESAEVSIAVDGTILRLDLRFHEDDETEDEDLELADLPEAVMQVIAEQFPELEIEEIERLGSSNGSNVRFKIEGEDPETGEIQVVLSPDGEVLRLKVDSDTDGLSDEEELEIGVDPKDSDTDDDVFPDGFEIANASNPGSASSQPQILSVSLEANERQKEFVLCVRTFSEGVFQLLEMQEDGIWIEAGPPFAGEGERCNLRLPVSAQGTGLFRVLITADQ